MSETIREWAESEYQKAKPFSMSRRMAFLAGLRLGLSRGAEKCDARATNWASPTDQQIGAEQCAEDIRALLKELDDAADH